MDSRQGDLREVLAVSSRALPSIDSRGSWVFFRNLTWGKQTILCIASSNLWCSHTFTLSVSCRNMLLMTVLLFFHREKFLRTLLQVEMMLKMWFPHVTPVAATQNPTPSLPPRWHQNQLCMPVKVGLLLLWLSLFNISLS